MSFADINFASRGTLTDRRIGHAILQKAKDDLDWLLGDWFNDSSATEEGLTLYVRSTCAWLSASGFMIQSPNSPPILFPWAKLHNRRDPKVGLDSLIEEGYKQFFSLLFRD